MRTDSTKVLQFAHESATQQTEQTLEDMAGIPAQTGLKVCGYDVDFECLSAWDLVEFKQKFKTSLARMGKLLRDDNLPEDVDPLEVIGFLVVRLVQRQNAHLTEEEILADLTIKKLRQFEGSLADVVEEKKIK
jgi:hypothetical protein